eukprot:600128-Rhodomonas_salina.1
MWPRTSCQQTCSTAAKELQAHSEPDLHSGVSSHAVSVPLSAQLTRSTAKSYAIHCKRSTNSIGTAGFVFDFAGFP